MKLILISCLLSIFSGGLIYFFLVFIKQNWVNTFHYFITFLLLPPVALVITYVISNNFALSLGMIGALSIVRFRSPVKNPLELVVYFALITLGIAYGVDIKWGLLLIGLITCTLLFGKIFELICKKYNVFNLFQYSFSINDGVEKHLVEVESKEEIDFLKNNKLLVFFSIKNKVYFYKLASSDKKLINSIKDELVKNKEIINIDVQYNN